VREEPGESGPVFLFKRAIVVKERGEWAPGLLGKSPQAKGGLMPKPSPSQKMQNHCLPDTVCGWRQHLRGGDHRFLRLSCAADLPRPTGGKGVANRPDVTVPKMVGKPPESEAGNEGVFCHE
jgi:hypothetical protein